MPARRELTLEEFRAREDARREQARLGMRRVRAERKAASQFIQRLTQPEPSVSTTPEPVNTTPPLSQTLSPPGLSTTDRLLERLAPFANRAFKPDPAFLAKLAECYPGVDLELELAAALDWLEEPRHAKRRCSKGFLANWVKKADADRLARVTATLSADYGPPKGHTGNGVYVQPQALQHNRRPDEPRLLTGDLTPIRPAELQRFQAERRKLSLEQRMAQWRGGGK